MTTQDPTHAFRRKKQCKACPWRVDVTPDEDIPNGYTVAKHNGLCHLKDKTSGIMDTGRIMGCHESPVDDPYACVGWLAHELGPGNNLGLRMAAMQGRIGQVETVGEQHLCIEDTVPTEKDES